MGIFMNRLDRRYGNKLNGVSKAEDEDEIVAPAGSIREDGDGDFAPVDDGEGYFSPLLHPHEA